VIDALLGAAALGDIGDHFPDTDERYLGADSIDLLAATVGKVLEAGFSIGSVDVTVLSEAPKLASYKGAIAQRLAVVLGVGVDAVNVKATRGEGMGFVGRGEGAAALAIATLEVSA
jgi:2-C-methyl-D-erythritol 2,4-cyclodiphosphate synthase